MRLLKISATVFIAMIIIAFNSAKSYSNQKQTRFEIRGKVIDLDKVTINLYSDGEKLQSILMKTNETFVFKMDWNFEYVLEIKKSGFVTQTVSISTIVPDEFDRENLEYFDLEEFNLYNKIPNLDIEFYKKPIMDIKYNDVSNSFNITYDYRNSLSQLINDFLKNEKKYKELLKDGFSYFKNKQYKLALESYKNALKLKPNDQFPKEKIKEIESFITVNKTKPKIQESKKESNKNNIQDIQKNEPENDNIETKNNTQIADKSTIDDDLLKLEQIKNGNDTKEILKTLNSLGEKYHNINNLKNALNYFNQSLRLTKKLDDPKSQSSVLNKIAIVNLDSGLFTNAINNYKKSLNLLKSINDKQGMSYNLKNIGSVYESTYQFSNALDSYKNALKLSKELDDKMQTSEIINSIGNVYLKKGNYNNAIEFYKQLIELDKKAGNESLRSNTYNNIGIAYYYWGKNDKAIENYENSIQMAEKSGNKKELSISLNNIGNINYDINEFTSALKYYEKSLKIKEVLDYKKGIALSLYNIGNVHKGLKEYNEAIKYYEKSNKIGNEINYSELKAKILEAFSNIYSLTGDYKKALKFYRKYVNFKLKPSIVEAKEQLSETSHRYELEKIKSLEEIHSLKSELLRQKLLAKFDADRNAKSLKIKDLEIQKKDQEVKVQRILTTIFIIGFIALLVFVILLIRLIKQKIEANKKLSKQRDKISAQKQEITDSIKYAEKIQTALIPKTEVLDRLGDNFIYFKPKDIVSGDFYWLTQINDKIIVAAVDCTGHGVPGAFMSMLGISFLNEIVNNEHELNSGEILNKLRNLIIESLHQTDEKEGARDGMDIALCVIDYKTMELQYSGAYNPLYYVKNNELIVFKADKMPIGIHKLLELTPFKTNKISINKGDCFYIFSDGYMDQFGGKEGKKYMSKNFKNLLLENSSKPLKDQKQILNETFKNWKQELNQIDDVLVIGIKI